MQPQPLFDQAQEPQSEFKVLEGVHPRWPLAVGVVFVLLLALGLSATRHGSAITPDSVQYLSTAHHVAAGDGVRTSITELTVPDPTIPFGPWPPLYPSALAGLVKLGISPLNAPRILNVFLLAMGVCALAWVAYVSGGPRMIPPVVFIHAALFYPVMMSAFAWSETMYILFSLTSLGLVGRGLRRHKGLAWEFVAAGILAGAAMLTRYIGFTLICATLSALWLLRMHDKPSVLWRTLALYAVPAIGMNAVWLTRNKLLTGHLFGEARPDAWFGWSQILSDTGKTLFLDWIAPIARHDAVWAAPLALVGVTGAVLLTGVLINRLRSARIKVSGRGTGLNFVLWIYTLVFLLSMILLSRRVGFDPINTRYLAPIYPVILVLGAFGFRRLMENDRRRTPGYAERNLVATSLIFLAIPQLAATGTLIAQAGTEVRTVTRPYWTSTMWDDATWEEDLGLRAIQQMAGPDTIVISNLWDLVGIRTGLSTKPLPETSWPGYPDRLWDFPNALIAVNRSLRNYRATADDLHALNVKTDRLFYLGEVGDWSFFKILGGKRAVS